MSAPNHDGAKKAWVTLLTRTSYVAGALTLNHSLIKHKSAYPLVVYATSGLPQDARDALKEHGVRVRDIEWLEPSGTNAAEITVAFERFRDTWTKLRSYELVEYERVVMLDSDMLVMKNMDELMTMDLPTTSIAAAHACTCNPRKKPDYPVEWTPEACAHGKANLTTPLAAADFSMATHHLLNSGLIVLHPSLEVFTQMEKFLHSDPIVQTFKFPDQDFLAHFYRDAFVSLGYQYNGLKTLRYCHPKMWSDDDVKNVHYIIEKPWNERVPLIAEDRETSSWWWREFEELEAEWKHTASWPLIRATVVA